MITNVGERQFVRDKGSAGSPGAELASAGSPACADRLRRLTASAVAAPSTDRPAATATVPYTDLILPFVIAGVGISMVVPATPTAALSAVPPADMGKASGVNNTLQRFGGVFGVAVVTAVFTATGHLGTPEQVAAGFRPALAVSAGLSVLGAATALAVTRRRPAPAQPPAGARHPAAQHATAPLSQAG